MIHYLRYAAAIGAMAAMGSSASAQAASGNTSTASGTATAVIIAPIVLSHTSGQSLNFGKFTTGTGGTVVVTAAGAGSVTGDVGFAPGSTNAADQFTVTGDNSRNFGITTASGTITNGTSTMSFTTTPSASSATTSSSGTSSFSVGGTLTVGTGLSTGTYTGTYTATVTYQ
jgi:hypothetical protein